MLRKGIKHLQNLLFNTTRFLVTSTRKSFPPQNAVLPEFLIESHNKYAEHTAMVNYVTGDTLTHGQIGEVVGKIANRLIDWGVKPGDHVAVSSFNHISYFPLSLGIMAAGARAAFCNPAYIEREMEQLFRTGDVSRAIGHPKNSSVVSSACKNLDLPEPLDITKILEESATYSSQRPRLSMLPHDTCSLFYSSGTTGFPKAVEITHDNFVSQCKILEDPEAFNFNTETVNNGFLPSFHVFGSVVGMHVLGAGAKAIVLDGFTPESFLGANQSYKVTFITVVPPIMVFLAKHPSVEHYDQSSLRDLVCAAAPCSKQLEEEVKSRLKNPHLLFRQGYGLSETSAACHFLSKGTEKQGSIGGVANNTSCKVVDISTGKECGPHEHGEIYVKGPCVMKGYYNNPKATKETMTEDGFLKTGDIGFFDEDGDFYIVDRVKEFIKVKGFQVAPAEVEALLLENPKIADAAVIGIPDEKTGEAPKAFVVKHPNGELSEEDVIAFVKDNAIKYKVPKEVEFISAIPKLPSGKIQRKVLRDAEKEKREATKDS